MPVRLEGYKTAKVNKVIVVRVLENIVQRRAGVSRAWKKKQRHLLLCAWRSVHPRIDRSIVVRILLNSQAHPATPRAVPEIALICGVVAVKEIAVWRRKDGYASCTHLRGYGAVVRGQRVTLRAVRRC